MATKKKATKKKTPKARKPIRLAAKKKPRFDGPQALLPGHKPPKRVKGSTYTAAGVDGIPRTVEMPAAPEAGSYAWRRRPHGHVRTYTARMELRMMPDQGTAWDRMAASARLTRAEWIRTVCDAAVAAGAVST